MEHGNENLIKELKQVINNADDIFFERQIAPNISHPVFVFKNYSSGNNQRFISMILPYNLSGNRLWMTPKESQLKAIGGNIPNYHPDYHCIEYQGTTYYPYSVTIEEGSFKPNVVKEILKQTYAHYNGNDA